MCLQALFSNFYPCSSVKVFSFVVESGCLATYLRLGKGYCYSPVGPEAHEASQCTGIPGSLSSQIYLEFALSRRLAKSSRLSDIPPRSFMSNWIEYEA